MDNLIVILILVCVVGASAIYIIKAKKRGEKCIGCPYAKACKKNSNCCNSNEAGNK